jgi:hypothetical protein
MFGLKQSTDTVPCKFTSFFRYSRSGAADFCYKRPLFKPSSEEEQPPASKRSRVEDSDTDAGR